VIGVIMVSMFIQLITVSLLFVVVAVGSGSEGYIDRRGEI